MSYGRVTSTPLPNPWTRPAGGGAQTRFLLYESEPPRTRTDEVVSIAFCPCCFFPEGGEGGRGIGREARARLCLRDFFFSFIFILSLSQIVLFIVTLAKGGVAPLSSNPMIGPPSTTLVEFGAKEGRLIRYSHEVWRMVSSIFLHGGFIHLFFNLAAQLLFGIMLERRWKLWVVLIYFLSGIGGSLMSCLISPTSISVGASGAILGLISFCLAEIIICWNKKEPMERQINLMQYGLAVVLGLLIGLSPSIDIDGHLGGIIVGFLIGCLFFSSEVENQSLFWCLVVFSVFSMVAFFSIGFSLFFTVINF